MIYKAHGYRLFDNIEDSPNYRAISEKEQEIGEKCHAISKSGNLRRANEIIKACKQFPNNPQLKNFLSTLYLQNEQTERALSVIDKTLDKHPDYIYARIQYCKILLDEEPFDEEEFLYVLGGDTIEKILPVAQPHHELDYINSVVCLIDYYYKKKDRKKMKEQESKLVGIDMPKHIGDYISYLGQKANMELLIKKREEVAKRATTLDFAIDLPKQEPSTIPEFKHEQIKTLYENDLSIKYNLIEEILQLPKETLIDDLELILTDSLRRYEYYLEKEEKEEDSKNYYFAYHAVLLLGEIGSAQTFKTLIDYLGNSTELLEFYFGYDVTDVFGEALYKLSKNTPDHLYELLLRSNVNFETKNAVVNAIECSYKTNQCSTKEMKNKLITILETYLTFEKEENIVSSEIIAIIVGILMDLKCVETIPLLKPLNEKFYIDPMVAGSIEEIEKEIKGIEKKQIIKAKELSLKQYYK